MEIKNEINLELPFVIYKKPKSAYVEFIQQTTDDIFKDNDLLTNGFYFYPFDNRKNTSIVFPENKTYKKRFFLREFLFDSLNNYSNIKLDAFKQAHIDKVKLAIDKIKEDDDLKKIIISSKIEISTSKFNWENSLLNLMNNYENSMVWVWFHPKLGMWMGATPEILLTYDNNIASTMALAGTLPVKNDEPIVWLSKEIEEQQIVTDYIIDKFHYYSTEIKYSKPKTIFQGDIAHIQTIINAKINSSKLNDLVLNLHPTPAVCGLPTLKAKSFIDKIEKYNRKYYTGFLGNKSKNYSQFFVNLRTLEIFDKKLYIYVGGGITKDSIPEKEWNEVVNKANIIIKNLSI